MQAQYLFGDQCPISYTPESALVAGQVVVINSVNIHVAIRDIAAGEVGALATAGVWRFVKNNEAFALEDVVHWNTGGDPLGGVAGSGAATTGGPYIGFARSAASSSDTHVDVAIEPTFGYQND